MSEEKYSPIKEFFANSGNFNYRSVEGVNHTPHRYVIGHRHVGYASDNLGGMLSENAIRECEKHGITCAHPNCRVPYDQHTCDTVCFISLKRNITVDEAQSELKGIDELFKSLGVDGFVFVDTPEKFRINNPAEQA